MLFAGSSCFDVAVARCVVIRHEPRAAEVQGGPSETASGDGQRGLLVGAWAALSGAGGARCGWPVPFEGLLAWGPQRWLLAMAVRLHRPWADPQASWEGSPPVLVVSPGVGAVLQGGVSSFSAVRPGVWPLGTLEGPRPTARQQCLVLAAPERPEREDLPKYDRAALPGRLGRLRDRSRLDVEEEKLTLIQGDPKAPCESH